MGIIKSKLRNIYGILHEYFGEQKWWPAEDKDEIVIGAVLTQNTAWINVESAIENLKKNGICSFKGILDAEPLLLKKQIKPAGFFNQKVQYLKNISEFFTENGGFEKLSEYNLYDLRNKLLSIKGIGYETADSILLYAFDMPIFVVDAYTKRILNRHNITESMNYHIVQKIFMDNCADDAYLFSQYHALIVETAKNFCRVKPLCDSCPLKDI